MICRQPLQSIVSGRIARIMFIQLQFVKKELLVAMQAIDQLFNSNQVNLQLLAITPAVITLFASQMVGKILWLLFQSTTQGKEIASKQLLYTTLRVHIRQLERDLLAFSVISSKEMISPTSRSDKDDEGITDTSHQQQLYTDIKHIYRGKIFSHLYRIHSFLSIHRVQFQATVLEEFQVCSVLCLYCKCTDVL